MSLPGDDSRRADTIRSLSDEEFPRSLDGLVDIISFGSAIREIVVGYVVKLMFFEELRGHNPGAVFDDLVDPFAVPDSFCSFLRRHDGQSLALVCFMISSYANHQCRVGKCFLGLFELAHVAVPV